MSARLVHRALALAACLALELPLGVAVHATSTVPAALVAASPPAGGVVLRDDLKREVAIAHAPQRIISLMPSLTETVCALGACDRLIATDRFSDWPPQVRGLPKAGGLDDPEIELIVSMKPDLVLISSSQRITNRLHELGIATFALNTESYTDIDRDVSVIGEILGLSARATSLAQAIESRRARDQRASGGAASRRGTVGVLRSGPNADCRRRRVLHRRAVDPAGGAQHRDGGLGSVPGTQSRICRARQSRRHFHITSRGSGAFGRASRMESNSGRAGTAALLFCAGCARHHRAGRPEGRRWHARDG